jgi:hypothetical protein
MKGLPRASLWILAIGIMPLWGHAEAAAPINQAAVAPKIVNFPAAREAVPFEKEADLDCDWMMHDPNEKWIRGGIGQGDDDPVIDLVDNAFKTWSDSEYHAIEVSAGDPARRVPAKAWAGSAAGDSPGSIGFYLNAELRRLIGGANSLQIWKDGKPVYNAVLEKTPTVAELDACVRPPHDPNSDAED